MFWKGENPAAVALIMWTPSIAAGLSAVILKVKLSNYGWRPGKLKFWGYACLLPVVVALVGYGIIWITGFIESYTNEVVNYKWVRMLGFETPAPFVAGLISKLFLASVPGFTMVIFGASIIQTTLIGRSKSFWVGMVIHTSHNVVLMRKTILNSGN